MKMFNFLFHDEITGEDFYVNAEGHGEAFDIARENFEEPVFVREDDDETAENSGLDTY